MRYYITTPDLEDIKKALPEPAEFVSYGKNGAAFKGHTFYGYVQYAGELDYAFVVAAGLIPAPVPTYYNISEELARRAKAAYSFFNYVEGSATASYRLEVDKASYMAHQHKQKVDPMYHEKIDRLLESFARRLAENTDSMNNNTAKVPSILIAGGSNFPVRAKHKQNAREDTLRREYMEIMGLLEKIRSVGTGGISSDDPNALEKLKAKVESLKKHQELMKAANSAIRLKDTEKGDRRLSELGYTAEEIAELRKPDYCGRIGYPSYELTNNNANIRRLEGRIKELEKRQTEEAPKGWSFEGGEVVINTDLNRVQIFFDGKPDEDMRSKLKGRGFRWAPSQKAWQRQYTRNAMLDAKAVTAVS